MSSKGQTKFFYYEMQCANEQEKFVKPDKILTNVDWVSLNNQLYVITSAGLMSEVNIEEVFPDFYFGKIIRSKEKSSYFGKKKGGTIIDLDTHLERVGEKEPDIVNFAFTNEGSIIIFIMEIGFQTPGMGLLKEYFSKCFPDYKFNYRPRTSKKADLLPKLYGKTLKKIILKFKKNPFLPMGFSEPENTLKQLCSSNYEIRIEASLHRIPKSKEGIQTLDSYIGNFFGQGLKSAIENGVDFPAFLRSFDVEVVDENNRVTEEKILDRYEKDTIILNKKSLHEQETLRYTLIKKLANITKKEIPESFQ